VAFAVHGFVADADDLARQTYLEYDGRMFEEGMAELGRPAPARIERASAYEPGRGQATQPPRRRDSPQAVVVVPPASFPSPLGTCLRTMADLRRAPVRCGAPIMLAEGTRAVRRGGEKGRSVRGEVRQGQVSR